MTKVQDLIKCKHPNSRKTHALVKQIKKAKARQKVKHVGNVKQNIIGEKLLWFKENLDNSVNIYTAKETLDIVEKYLSRFDEELEQIKIKHSIGNRRNRQHASREDIINMTLKNEKEEFQNCGLEMPDLLDSTQFKLLKDWNGELRFLPKFKLKRFNKAHFESMIKRSDSQESTQKKQCKEASSSMDLS